MDMTDKSCPHVSAGAITVCENTRKRNVLASVGSRDYEMVDNWQQNVVDDIEKLSKYLHYAFCPKFSIGNVIEGEEECMTCKYSKEN